jgi:hypothetical protein
MTNNKDLQEELQAKIKAGIKPSDLKKSKSTPLSRSSLQQEKYVAELETEKADLLTKLANYDQEQKASVKVFQDQEKLLDQKEQQLISKDEQLTEKEEQLEKLKTRIHQLFKDKQEQNTQEITTEEATTQTEEEITSPNFEEQLLEKRLQILQEFSTYRKKLIEKEDKISRLTNQNVLYQQKISKLTFQPNNNEKKVVLLTILLVITTLLLIFK